MKFNFIVDEVQSRDARGYTPFQIVKAYNLKEKNNGSGIKVGFIDFIGNGYIQSNLNIFSKEFGLDYSNIEYISNQNNRTRFDFNAYIEPCADTQWVHAIAPKADLLVVQAEEYSVKGAVDAVEIALNNGADVILQTFQAPFLEEYTEYYTLYREEAVFVASAGDYGAGAFFPSCFRECISVGGTSLKIDDEGNRIGEETVWNGSGGGICSYVEIPDHQLNFIPINNLTDGMRGVPDVSFLSDPDPGFAVYHSSINGGFGWYTAGGTSLAASIIAGIIANILSYDNRIAGKEMIRWLYNVAGKTKYTNKYNIFQDIVTGSNGSFTALPGYDLCTGLGSLKNI